MAHCNRCEDAINEELQSKCNKAWQMLTDFRLNRDIFDEYDMIGFAEWLDTETSYKRYYADDDNDGMWHDIHSEDVHRHYYTDAQLIELYLHR